MVWRKSQAVHLQIKRRPTANKSLCWFVSENFSEFSQETLSNFWAEKKPDPFGSSLFPFVGLG
jgi:hypothetical protein